MRKILAWGVAGAALTTICLLVFLLPAFGELPKQKNKQKETKKGEGVAGFSTCEGCHEDAGKQLGKTAMGRLFLNHPRNAEEKLACETCHGPGQAHAESEGKEPGGIIRFSKNSSTPPAIRNEACLTCHQKKNLLFWQGGAHQMRDMTCSDCHTVHKGATQAPGRKMLARQTVTDTCGECHKQQVAEQMRFSHHPLREGKMECTSCHNPHGTASMKLLKGNTTNEVCYSCHAEKRGPFLFEHPPVMEDCSNCHAAHGSNYPRLQKHPEIRQCRMCHANIHRLSFKMGAKRPAPHVLGRACSSCHTNIHGSNHPTGHFFNR